MQQLFQSRPARGRGHEVVVNYNEIKKLFNLILIEINYSRFPYSLRAKPFFVKWLQPVEIPRQFRQKPLCQQAK
jgi:hypothetical protein